MFNLKQPERAVACGFSQYPSFEHMLKNPDVWDLSEHTTNLPQYVWLMTKEELTSAILQMVLAVTMWEIIYQTHVHFTKRELLAHVNKENQRRVLNMFNHPTIQDLVNVMHNGEIRIIRTQDKLRKVMNITGVVYD